MKPLRASSAQVVPPAYTGHGLPRNIQHIAAYMSTEKPMRHTFITDAPSLLLLYSLQSEPMVQQRATPMDIISPKYAKTDANIALFALQKRRVFSIFVQIDEL